MLPVILVTVNSQVMAPVDILVTVGSMVALQVKSVTIDPQVITYAIITT